ncbi:MAG: hypothetical protein ACRBN8_33525 [Nannocystales bacterium]
MSPSIPGMDVLIADVAAGRLRGTEAFDEIVACIAAHETPAQATDEERQLVVEQTVRAVSQDRALCELLFAPPQSAGPKPAPAVMVKPKLQPVEVLEADEDPFSGEEEDDDDAFFEDDGDDGDDLVAPLPLTDEEIDAELEAIEREREARQGGGFESPQRRGQLVGALVLGAVVVGGGSLWFMTRPDTCDKLVKRICLEGKTKSCETVEFGKALAAKDVGEDKCVSVMAALNTAVEGKKKSEKTAAFDRALVEALGFDPRGDDAPKIAEPKPTGPPPPTLVIEGQLGIADVFIDHAHVYWTSSQPPGVFRARNIGGAIEPFGAHADAIDVTPTKDFLYWVVRGPTGGQIWVDKLRGAHAPTTIPLEGFSPTRAAFLGGEFAFIDGTTGAVMMASVDGGLPRVLVPGRPVIDPKARKPKTPPPPGPAAFPTELQGDATHVFVLSPAPVSTVWAVPRDGQAPPRALATGQTQPRTLTLDATHVYWVEAGAGAITRVPKTGGVPELLATGQAGAAGLATDTASVYWTNEPAGTVHSVPKAGGEVTTVASSLSNPSFVAVDSVAVFYESGGTIFRQAR